MVSGMPRKFAVTDLTAFMVTVHVVSETASHPSHPVKIEPRAGVAVNATVVPLT